MTRAKTPSGVVLTYDRHGDVVEIETAAIDDEQIDQLFACGEIGEVTYRRATSQSTWTTVERYAARARCAAIINARSK